MKKWIVVGILLLVLNSFVYCETLNPYSGVWVKGSVTLGKVPGNLSILTITEDGKLEGMMVLDVVDKDKKTHFYPVYSVEGTCSKEGNFDIKFIYPEDGKYIMPNFTGRGVFSRPSESLNGVFIFYADEDNTPCKGEVQDLRLKLN